MEGKKRILGLLLTFAIAVAGGIIGIKLKLPAGGLVGAMLAVALVQTAGGLHLSAMPAGTMTLLQIMVGMMIGLGITREAVLEMKEMVIPGLVLVICMVVVGISLGFLIKKLSNLDVVTSLYSTAPGGMTDMVLIVGSQGADTPKVALMHLMRLAGVILILPPLAKWLAK